MESMTPRAGRGRTRAAAFLCGGTVAAASMLALAGSAVASPDPLKGGETTITFKASVSKAAGGATKSGKTVTLPITGGSLDPTTGKGDVANGGTVTLKKGKKKVTLSAIATSFGGDLKAKVGKKTKTLGTIDGGAVGRAGFGGTVSGASIKLSKGGAKALNKALKTKKFKKGKSLGTADVSTVPQTVGVTSATSDTVEALADPATCVPAQNCPYAVKTALDGLTPVASDGAVIDTSNPTAPKLSFTPQTGGEVAPDCSSGNLTGSKGKLTFSNALLYGTKTLTQSDPVDAFGTKNVTFDASSTQPSGGTTLVDLGRNPATDLDMSGAVCTADPANHKITITNVVQTVTFAAASTANQTFGLTDQGPCTGPKPGGECPLKAGDLIGVTSYVIHTQ